MAPTRNQIFEYSDPVLFLSDYLDNQPHMSLSKMAEDLELKSPTSLSKILKRQRDIGSQILKKIVHYFQFSEKESLYFEKLVSLYKEKDIQKKIALMEELKGISKKDNIFEVDMREFESISNPLYFVIRELPYLKGFQWNIDRLKSTLRFKASKFEIKKALETLISLKLIKKNSDGSLESSTLHFSTPHEVASEAIKRFHKATLELAKLAVDEQSIDERHFLSTTVSLKRDQLAQAKKDLDDFNKYFIEKYSSKEGDEIYQMNLNLFAHTKREEKE